MASALNAPYFHDDDAARAYLEAIRWPNNPVCPHCQTEGEHYRLQGKSTRKGLLKCADCRKPFSVTVGTVFERSKIPLSKWLAAAFLLCSSKKGISAHQLHRTLGVTYKTAWFLAHRIRFAMSDAGGGLLGGDGTSGIVEADETYLGKTKGQGSGPHLSKKQKVVALVERGGPMRAFHVPTITSKTMKPLLEAHVSPKARLMTDSSPIYKKAGQSFQTHETVNHLIKEYARGDVTTNTVEGFFGTFKRGLHGTYQHVGQQHLHRYVDEFAFRYNHRASLEINDTQRVCDALKGIEGKRLTYR